MRRREHFRGLGRRQITSYSTSLIHEENNIPLAIPVMRTTVEFAMVCVYVCNNRDYATSDEGINEIGLILKCLQRDGSRSCWREDEGGIYRTKDQGNKVLVNSLDC